MNRTLVPLAVTTLFALASTASAATLDDKASGDEVAADDDTSQAKARRGKKSARNGNRKGAKNGQHARHAKAPVKGRKAAARGGHGRAHHGPRAANAVHSSGRHVPAHRGAQHTARHPTYRGRVAHHRTVAARHRHATAARNVVWRWRPYYHRYHLRGRYAHWHPRYWGAGVFFYSPAPAAGAGVVWVDDQRGIGGGGHGRERAIDRNGDFSLGIRGGSYMSGYEGGYGGYGDFGLGLTAAYRVAEPVSLELAWEYHDESFTSESERITKPLQASVRLHAFPWTRVSPYVLAGLTWTSRNYNDVYNNGLTYETVQTKDTLFGPHGGLGVELAVGSDTSVNFEARYAGYLNVEDGIDPSIPGALQASMGLNFYF